MKKVLIFIFIFITLCGCSMNSSTVFKGESKSWSASYTIENPRGEYHGQTLKIKY